MKRATITLENGQTFETLCSPNYTDSEIIEKWTGKPCHGPTPEGMQWSKAVSVILSQQPRPDTNK